MEARFTNGSSVSRIWSDDHAELLAAFQYHADAISFAQARMVEDGENKLVASYVVCETQTGAVTVLRFVKPKAGAQS
jgi:hypothetical protein